MMGTEMRGTVRKEEGDGPFECQRPNSIEADCEAEFTLVATMRLATL